MKHMQQSANTANPMKKTVLVLLSCLGAFSAAAAGAGTKPHILFILVE